MDKDSSHHEKQDGTSSEVFKSSVSSSACFHFLSFSIKSFGHCIGKGFNRSINVAPSMIFKSTYHFCCLFNFGLHGIVYPLYAQR
jgi:hypothetical protein